MKRINTFVTTLAILAAIASKPAIADTNCQSIYGGGEGCGNGTLTVEKQVLKPGTSDQYVDNLSIQDPHFQPLSPIFFKIIIKNMSNTNLTNILVKDTIDSTREFIDFSDGPGNFDTGSKTLTYSISSLNAGQTNTQIIQARVSSLQNLPSNQNTVCPVNTVQANANNTQPTSATSQYCIDIIVQPTQNTTKGGLPIQNPTGQQNSNQSGGNTSGTNANQAGNFPVFTPSTNTKSTPKTGPEELPLLAMIPTGAIGMWLRKKAK